MRSARSEHLVIAVLLALPLVIALIGWPAFVRWAVDPGPRPTPEVAGAAATSVATAQGSGSATAAPPTNAPRARPTQPAAATPATAATPTAVAQNAPQVVRPTATPPPAQATQVAAGTADSSASAADPSAAVQDFYAHVAQHDFASAAALWTPRMRSAFPPQENIDARFSQTRSITLRRADVVSESGNQAAVAVDLVESAADGQHHWSGSWQVVRGPNGWLLDEPRLQPD
jgi:cytoskeletal protein RodZ